jgi:NAD(P)H-dependent FMN reductase
MLGRLGAELLEQAGAMVKLVDLTDHDLPIYNGDIERQHGLPAPAMELKRLFKEANGFLFASPEHNASISALLKNAIDWASRAVGQESGKVPFDGKVAGLCSASTGGMGGHRGLMHLRLVLCGLGVHVLPGVVSVGGAAAAFNDCGGLKDSGQIASMRLLANSLVGVASRMYNNPA